MERTFERTILFGYNASRIRSYASPYGSAAVAAETTLATGLPPLLRGWSGTRAGADIAV